MENNVFSLSGKTALVTGGSRGSGVVFVYGSCADEAGLTEGLFDDNLSAGKDLMMQKGAGLIYKRIGENLLKKQKQRSLQIFYLI